MTMEKERNTPSIRFKGFTDPWEQCKLGEIANKVTTKNAEGKYTETFTNSAEYGIISQDDFFDYGISNPENINGYYIIENDDFVYNPRISKSAPVGPINRNKLGRIGVMSPLYLAFKVTNVDESFLEWYFKSTYWHPFMYFNGDTGARSDRFSIKDKVFFEMPIPLPHIEEQKQIGSTLENIDSLITLHQRKLDQEKTLKKYLLQNMFPREGENVPRIRFLGFTGPWEQRKLGDISSVIDPHPSHRAPVEVESGIPFIGIGDVDEAGNINYSTARIVDEKIYEEHHKRYDLAIPSIGIGRVASLGKVIRLRNDVGKYAVSPTMSIIQFSKEADMNCMYSFMSSPSFQRQFTGQSNGSTRQSVGIQDLRKLKVSMPQDKAEQIRIGLFFWNLDSIITLHQQKLESLKALKKSFLQKMFV